MTPSGWHDDARHRDAGHDEMQARVWRTWKLWVDRGKPFECEAGPFTPDLAEVEFPLNLRGADNWCGEHQPNA